MKPFNFDRVYDRELVSMIQELTQEASSIKAVIFKSKIMKSSISKSSVQHYLSYVHDFIASWNEYSERILEKMSAVSGSQGVRTIEYESVKDYVYANYDYASVLWFASRLITGIKENKFTKSEDVEDFFDSTLSKAFDGIPSTTAGLLDSVTSSSINTRIFTNALEAKMFDSVKRYKKLFDRRDQQELYKSIKATVEFLSSELSIQSDMSISDAKLFAAMINYIIEYITYSVTAFATRIYIISVYALPFIDFDTPHVPVKFVSESTDPEELSHIDSIEVTIMRDADEVDFKNSYNFKESMSKMKEFLKVIGVVTDISTISDTHRAFDLNSNIFSGKLIDNPLNEYLLNRKWDRIIFDNTRNKYTEVNNILKEFIYNGKQGLETTSSSKQAIIHIIRVLDAKTLNEYKDLSKDLFMYSSNILSSILELKNQIESNMRYDETSQNCSLSELNMATENIRMLDELYRDISFASLQKARDIEMSINVLKGSHLKDVMGNISVKVPGENKEVNITTNNSSLSAPDSMRIPLELADMYSMPAFESMQMYDEYLRMVTEFADDMYLSEAFNISEAVNKFVSMLKGFLNKIRSFYENKKLDLSVKWVTSKKGELTSMDFSNATMQVLPYKKDGIGLPKGFENLEKGLEGFDPAKFTNEQAVENFIKSLYPDPVIYEWFAKDNTVGIRMYKNYILYQELNEVKPNAPELITIKGRQINAYLNDWIATMEGSSNVYKEIKKISDNYIAKVEGIKSSTVSATSGSSSSGNTGGSTDDKSNQNAPQLSSGKTQSENADKKQEQNKSDQKQAEQKDGTAMNGQTGELINKAINGMEVAANRIWGILLSTFIEYTKTQYDYIKEAYSIGNKKS